MIVSYQDLPDFDVKIGIKNEFILVVIHVKNAISEIDYGLIIITKIYKKHYLLDINMVITKFMQKIVRI